MTVGPDYVLVWDLPNCFVVNLLNPYFFPFLLLVPDGQLPQHACSVPRLLQSLHALLLLRIS